MLRPADLALFLLKLCQRAKATRPGKPVWLRLLLPDGRSPLVQPFHLLPLALPSPKSGPLLQNAGHIGVFGTLDLFHEGQRLLAQRLGFGIPLKGGIQVGQPIERHRLIHSGEMFSLHQFQSGQTVPFRALPIAPLQGPIGGAEQSEPAITRGLRKKFVKEVGGILLCSVACVR